MNTCNYQFRVSGLREDQGQIRAKSLVRVIDGLLKSAERVTNLLATGSGTRRGNSPAWLDATVDFMVTGQRPGSTILDIEAPQIGDTAAVLLTQQELWPRRPAVVPTDTALDLVSLAIAEVLASNPVGDYFDSSVLEAILKFARADDSNGVVYKLESRDSARQGFVIDGDVCSHITRELQNIPAPKMSVVSGRLEEIRHSNGRFLLCVNPGSRILGKLDTSSLLVEALRKLWGRQTTVQGLVHFKASGHPRLIEAYKVSSYQEGDRIFEELPSAGASGTRSLSSGQQRTDRPAKPMDLSDTWPGDEPIEELLAQLD